MAQTFDVIVVGMGAMGSSTMYQLAKRGLRVLGIDQFEPPHKFGSTHGETRMTRAACAEGFIFTKFAQRSHEIWRDIENQMGRPASLLTLNGQLVISGPDVNPSHGVEFFLGATKDQAKHAGIQHDNLSSAEVRARFPMFSIEDNEAAYHDALSGFVRPEDAIQAQLSLAETFHAATHTGERMIDFSSTASGVHVRTSKGEYAANMLVLTTGPWLPAMLPADEKEKLKVTRQVLYWFALKREEDLPMFRAERLPTFLWFKPDPGFLVYGFPALGSARDGIKLATEQKNPEPISPELVDRVVSAREQEEFYEMYVRPSFPALSEECVRAEVCLYTDKKRARFIIDRHPEMENVICVSACSGHGFKHSPAIGELVADMVMTPGHQGLAQFRWQYDGVL